MGSHREAGGNRERVGRLMEGVEKKALFEDGVGVTIFALSPKPVDVRCGCLLGSVCDETLRPEGGVGSSTVSRSEPRAKGAGRVL